MLPDLPKAKAMFRKSFNEFLVTRARQYSELPLSEEGYQVVHEGGGMLMNYQDNKSYYSPLHRLGTQMSVDIDVLIENPFAFYMELDKMAKEMGEQQGRMFFATITDITDKFEQTSSRKGDPTPDDILNMFEKLSVSFNEDGQPNLPSIYCGTDMLEKMKRAMEEFATNKDYQNRFEEIIKRKKQDWFDRENNRKLVD